MLKRLSIFFIFIFFISILGVTFHHHEGMLHDDCLICCITDNDGTFLTQDHYHVFSNDCNISALFKGKDIITPYTVIRKFFTRAPPA
jgi:hypothetical protein